MQATVHLVEGRLDVGHGDGALEGGREGARGHLTNLRPRGRVVNRGVLTSRGAVNEKTNAALRKIGDLSRKLGQYGLVTNETALLLPEGIRGGLVE